MQQKRPSLRLRLASAILGTKTKDFIQTLSPLDGWQLNASSQTTTPGTQYVFALEAFQNP